MIFTAIDVTNHIPLQHALKILEVFHEMFEGIPNLELMVELFGRENPNLLLLPQPLKANLLMQSDSDSSVDIEEEFIQTRSIKPDMFFTFPKYEKRSHRS